MFENMIYRSGETFVYSNNLYVYNWRNGYCYVFKSHKFAVSECLESFKFI